MWQGSQNLRATQKESHALTKQMTAVGYISDTEEIIKALWSLFHHAGAAAYKFSERSPLPPPWSAKDHPGGRTQILNVRRIRRNNRHPVVTDEECTPESISDCQDWLDWNGNIDNSNAREDDCAADVETDIEQDNRIEDPECLQQREVSAAPNVPGLIRPTPQSKRQAEKVLMTVNAIEMRRNEGVKGK